MVELRLNLVLWLGLLVLGLSTLQRMNCWKFATVKSGTVTSSFTIKFTDGENPLTGSASANSSLNLDLTYKDLCKINKGVQLDKPWAIRGPECDRYHVYKGTMVVQKLVGPLASYGYGNDAPYDVYMVLSYNLFGCAYEDFSGRLNAYGRKAKKAKDDAPPPDPDSPEPCITQAGFFMLGVPEGTEPDADLTRNILIDYGISPGLTFAYGSANNEPFTSTGSIGLKYNNQEAEDGYSYINYDVEIIGTRNLEIRESYGE